MKIVEGHFPWQLLYVPLAIALMGAVGFVTITGGGIGKLVTACGGLARC